MELGFFYLRTYHVGYSWGFHQLFCYPLDRMLDKASQTCYNIVNYYTKLGINNARVADIQHKRTVVFHSPPYSGREVCYLFLTIELGTAEGFSKDEEVRRVRGVV